MAISMGVAVIRPEVRDQAPPSYRALAALLEEEDPLQPDTVHSASARLRRVIQARRIIGAASRPGTLDEAIHSLRRLKEVEKAGYNYGPSSSGARGMSVRHDASCQTVMANGGQSEILSPMGGSRGDIDQQTHDSSSLATRLLDWAGRHLSARPWGASASNWR